MSTIEQRNQVQAHGADGEKKGPPEPLSERVRSLRLPAGATAVGGRSRWKFWTILVVVAAAAAFLGFSFGKRKATGDGDAADEKKTAAAGQNANPGSVADSGEIVLQSKGYVIPIHEILISPLVNGRIEQSFILEGKRITQEQIDEGARSKSDKTGDVLAIIENTEYLNGRDRAAAMLAASQQRLLELQQARPREIEQADAAQKEADAEFQQLLVQWERDRKLHAKKVISDQDMDLSNSKYEAARQRLERLKAALAVVTGEAREARIRAAEQDVRQAEMELATAQWRLDNCVIRAPRAGTILKKNAEVGNIVNAMAMQGTYSLCTMANLAELEIDMTIQERYIAKIVQGQKCRIRAEAYLDRTYDGVVSRIMPVADRGKGSISVRVKVLGVPPEEEGVYLKPDMGASVDFLRPDKPAAKTATKAAKTK